MTTRAKRSAKSRKIEALLTQDHELLNALVKESLQEVLEAEMTEAVGAGPGERTAERVGDRAGYYRYVQGVSTRKVKVITEELCGHTFSASTISRINRSLDGVLHRFATRRLEEAYPYVILDARYEKVRLDGVIHSQAVLLAIGINGRAGGSCSASTSPHANPAPAGRRLSKASRRAACRAWSLSSPTTRPA